MGPSTEKRMDGSIIELAWSRGIGVKVQRGYLWGVDEVALASASNFRDFMV